MSAVTLRSTVSVLRTEHRWTQCGKGGVVGHISPFLMATSQHWSGVLRIILIVIIVKGKVSEVSVLECDREARWRLRDWTFEWPPLDPVLKLSFLLTFTRCTSFRELSVLFAWWRPFQLAMDRSNRVSCRWSRLCNSHFTLSTVRRLYSHAEFRIFPWLINQSLYTQFCICNFYILPIYLEHFLTAALPLRRIS